MININNITERKLKLQSLSYKKHKTEQANWELNNLLIKVLMTSIQNCINHCINHPLKMQKFCTHKVKYIKMQTYIEYKNIQFFLFLIMS